MYPVPKQRRIHGCGLRSLYRKIQVVISSIPIFATSDILATLQFYKEVLGFETTWTYGEPPTFGSASGGGTTIMFNLQPELAAKVGGHQHWIKVDEVDELYRKHLANGATIVTPIADKPWGAREYVVSDPNGYHLRFAGSPAPVDAPKSSAFPEGASVLRRLPTKEEYLRVAGETFGYSDSAKFLETAWNGVVALSPEGDAIGALRIMNDAPNWFSIWDVAVLPDWQNRRIGSAMMKEAIAMIQEVAPGAIVYLFTYKHGFYERLGFATETVSMRRV